MNIPWPEHGDLFSVMVVQVKIYFSLAKFAHHSSEFFPQIPQIASVFEFCTHSLYLVAKVHPRSGVF